MTNETNPFDGLTEEQAKALARCIETAAWTIRENLLSTEQVEFISAGKLNLVEALPKYWPPPQGVKS